jgi:hypothetical protein
MTSARKAWVLWFTYSDSSGTGIERVYDNEDRAKDDFALVSEEQGLRKWHLDEVPFFTTGVVMR